MSLSCLEYRHLPCILNRPCSWSSLQAYTEELVDLHRRLMALRERNVLQQVCVHAMVSHVDKLEYWHEKTMKVLTISMNSFSMNNVT